MGVLAPHEASSDTLEWSGLWMLESYGILTVHVYHFWHHQWIGVVGAPHYCQVGVKFKLTDTAGAWGLELFSSCKEWKSATGLSLTSFQWGWGWDSDLSLQPGGDFPDSSAGKEFACNVGDLGSIPGLGRSPGEGKGYPLQYSGLENSMDCIVHGVAKSQTLAERLSLTAWWELRSKIPLGVSGHGVGLGPQCFLWCAVAAKKLFSKSLLSCKAVLSLCCGAREQAFC